eukprot:TRINITY_DN2136_c0_g1_i1.p1 TRINITY_DN2136_c0_g1~~TRINITY_DN2136_c0_g1_i1.p1  ORF type:complete len:214 (+),score=35.97 TRINITY_DN2136_c0_g1_i1:28-642(+)
MCKIPTYICIVLFILIKCCCTQDFASSKIVTCDVEFILPNNITTENNVAIYLEDHFWNFFAPNGYAKCVDIPKGNSLITFESPNFIFSSFNVVCDENQIKIIKIPANKFDLLEYVTSPIQVAYESNEPLKKKSCFCFLSNLIKKRCIYLVLIVIGLGFTFLPKLLAKFFPSVMTQFDRYPGLTSSNVSVKVHAVKQLFDDMRSK